MAATVGRRGARVESELRSGRGSLNMSDGCRDRATSVAVAFAEAVGVVFGFGFTVGARVAALFGRADAAAAAAFCFGVERVVVSVRLGVV